MIERIKHNVNSWQSAALRVQPVYRRYPRHPPVFRQLSGVNYLDRSATITLAGFG